MTEWARRIMDDMGYLGVTLLMTIENLFPPIPSEFIMPFAGYASARGDLSFPGVVAAGLAGSVLGALPLYALGARVGREGLQRWAGKYGRWLTVWPEDLERAFRWFERHGTMAVLFGRFVPGIRSLISIPAGVVRMPLGRFLVATAIGTGLWAAGLAWVGRALGENHRRVARVLDPILYAVIGIAVATYLVRFVRQSRRAARSGTYPR